jgi:hypothetical protein
MSNFSKQQLYQLRNQIPINWLIHDVLSMMSIYNGVWRFQCPVCLEFNTATQEKTNLARCFSCQKNFNTIELVIYVEKLSFKQSVEFLMPYLRKFSDEQINHTEHPQKGAPQATLKKSDPIEALKEIEKIRQLLK